MSQVTVVCPGARRCNVRVSPNTVLLQVLEQACSRQKLDPALYTLKHHVKLLDLSLPLRFSGVPNNGKLELVETERPRSSDTEVVVAVQTEDGKRIQSTFHSTASLWDVLTQHKLDSSPDGLEPSLLYMRQEVCGEESLRSTLLRSIGLSSGRAVLRLRHTTRSECVSGESVSVAAADTREQERHQTSEKATPQGEPEMEMAGEKDEDDNEPRKKPPPTSNVAMDTTEGEELPYFPAHPFSYFSGPTVGEQEMEGAGFSNPHLSLDPLPPAGVPEHPGLFHPEVVAAQLDEIATSPFAHQLARPHPLAPPLSQPQPKIYDEPCDRERVVYSLNDALPLSPTEEVSDAFFKHTVTDMQVMHSDLKKQASTSDAPLMTSAMRAVRDELRLEKYKESIVRVYFSDRWVLQGCFKPRESLKMLVVFIRENLADPSVKFHLYTTPPKTVLMSARVTFAEVGFLPTAVVYVGVEDDKPHPHLSDSALEHAVSALEAEAIHRKHRVCSSSAQPLATSGPSNQPQSGPRPAASGTSSSRASHSSTGDGGTTKKLPKWFRTGPK